MCIFFNLFSCRFSRVTSSLVTFPHSSEEQWAIKQTHSVVFGSFFLSVLVTVSPLFLSVSLNSRLFWPLIWIFSVQTEVSQSNVARLVLFSQMKGNKCTEVLQFQYVFDNICVFYAPTLYSYMVSSSHSLSLVFLLSLPDSKPFLLKDFLFRELLMERFIKVQQLMSLPYLETCNRDE